LVCIFGCSKKADWSRTNRSQIHECRNWGTEYYTSVLEITSPRSFISGNTSIGTKHLYWILTSPSFAVSAWISYWKIPVSDLLAKSAATVDQVSWQVPDQEHECSNGGRRETSSVSTRGNLL
jgi:hypothetical protein